MFKSLAVLSLVFISPVYGEDLPDPTRPLEYSESRVEQQQLMLHSILISNGRKIAVINGIQVKEQEWFGDKQVIRISENSVVLKSQNSVVELSLFGKSVRQ